MSSSVLQQMTFRDARILRQQSQRDLAQTLGVSVSTIGLWETGRTQPAMRHRRLLAQVLQLSEVEMYQIFPPRPRRSHFHSSAA